MADGGRIRRKNKNEKREGYLLEFIKSTWYTFALGLFLIAGAIVFMGIEGNHEEFVAYRLLEEQHEFNTSLRAWFLSDKAGAVKLREDLGLKETMDVKLFNEIFDGQFNKNFTNIRKFMQRNCSQAKNILTSWNKKNSGDAFKYAISIMSTVGYGVFYPPDVTLRIITILYLMFGIPLFGALINQIVCFLDWFEKKMVTKQWVKKYLGDETIFHTLQLVFVIIVVLLYAVICDQIVEAERESKLKDLLIEAGIFDEWHFFNALYFAVQTVTTIGFGDIYIYSPKHALLHIGPVAMVIMDALIIALFSRVFNRFQANVEKSATKKTVRARNSIASINLGVMRINRQPIEELDEISEEIDEIVCERDN